MARNTYTTNTLNQQGLKKSRTFQLTKSGSMDKSYLPPAAAGPSSTVEFPTSPQLILGEEMLHFGHPQHPLSLVNVPDLFTCAGCKEYGAGKRFVCQRCNYHLHQFCASAPPTLKAHPLHCHHLLLLFSKPVKGAQSKCDVCSKASRGYAFRCSACGFQMHPCCAMLTPEIKLPLLHAHTLRLLPPPGPGDQNLHDAACGGCNRKRSGRLYRCGACEYHLHAVCAKVAINGLLENGIKVRDKADNNMMKVVTQVMIELLGGLIGGLAEGFGQVIAQDVVKAKSSKRSSTTK